MSESKSALDVARRCLCLELLAQRYLLESDDSEPVADREKARASWASRHTDLGVAGTLLDAETALLTRPVGTLGEEELDDVHGRATGALVLLWALGRLEKRPTFAEVDAMADVLADHGLLGDGSIARAKAAAESATLRAEKDRDDAIGAYLRLRGKAREVTDPERIFAEVAAHHLTWIADAEMAFEDDIDVE